MSEEGINEAKSGGYTILGFALTGIVLLGFVLLLLDRWEELPLMKLNELGDLFAGVGGVLAFVWLVCGYLQQGVELRNNAEALKLQAKELALSVTALQAQAAEMRTSNEVQADVARFNREQWYKNEMAAAQAIEQLKPVFELQSVKFEKNSGRTTISIDDGGWGGDERSSEWSSLEVKLRNFGGYVTLLSDDFDGLYLSGPNEMTWPPAQSKKFMSLNAIDLIANPLSFKYRQEDGVRAVFYLHVLPDDEKGFRVELKNSHDEG